MKDNIVYIIGAGFSAPLGLPVMSNFLEKSKDMYFDDPSSYPHFKDVFDMINKMSVSKNYYETDLFNIEEILSILEMEAFLKGGRLPEKFKKYIKDVINHYTPKIVFNEGVPANWEDVIFTNDKLISSFSYFVASLFEFTFNLQVLKPINQNPERSIIVKSNEKQNNNYSILSLNYDLVFERIITSINDTYKPTSLYNYNKESPQSGSYKPNFYKLHGSTDSNLIVPPTWAKGTEKEIKPVWKNAYNVLKDANHIRFIGYSLPVADSYIKYLLKSAVLHNEHLKRIDVICLDNKNDEVSKRYNEFISFNNLRFVNTDIINYMDFIKQNTTKKKKPVRFVGDDEEYIEFNKLELSHSDFMKNAL